MRRTAQVALACLVVGIALVALGDAVLAQCPGCIDPGGGLIVPTLPPGATTPPSSGSSGGSMFLITGLTTFVAGALRACLCFYFLVGGGMNLFRVLVIGRSQHDHVAYQMGWQQLKRVAVITVWGLMLASAIETGWVQAVISDAANGINNTLPQSPGVPYNPSGPVLVP